MKDFLIHFENGPIPKPHNVKLAISLLLLVISVATLRFFLNLILTDFYTFKVKAPNYLISLSLFVFLAFHINARRNWARILYIVLLLIAMFTIPSNIISLMSVDILSALILFVQTLLQVGAAVAILTKSSNNWFKTRK